MIMWDLFFRTKAIRWCTNSIVFFPKRLMKPENGEEDVEIHCEDCKIITILKAKDFVSMAKLKADYPCKQFQIKGSL